MKKTTIKKIVLAFAILSSAVMVAFAIHCKKTQTGSHTPSNETPSSADTSGIHEEIESVSGDDLPESSSNETVQIQIVAKDPYTGEELLIATGGDTFPEYLEYGKDLSAYLDSKVTSDIAIWYSIILDKEESVEKESMLQMFQYWYKNKCNDDPVFADAFHYALDMLDSNPGFIEDPAAFRDAMGDEFYEDPVLPEENIDSENLGTPNK